MLIRLLRRFLAGTGLNLLLHADFESPALMSLSAFVAHFCGVQEVFAGYDSQRRIDHFCASEILDQQFIA